MKRLLCAIMLMLALVFALSACAEYVPLKPTITVSDDGYLVVNGMKTEYEVNEEDVITIEDGYLVVNGVKTEYEVNKADVITIDDGYLVVNGVKTEYEVNKEDVITIEDGYLVVNGVKTEHEAKNKNHSFGDWRLYNGDEEDCEKKLYYRTCTDCSTIEWREGKYADHDFKTVTTKPTCQAGGYDTKTCEICGKVEVCNETPLSNHDYNTEYLADNSSHWYKCKNCDAIDGRGEHTLGDDGICTVCNEVVGATEGVVYDFSADGTYAIVLDYVGTAKRIKIADEYKGVPVKEIYNEAFQGTSITSVIIPNSVTSVGEQAFYDCRSLASVVIGDSVTSIGYRAFYGCRSLASVVIGDSVASIGDDAFYNCNPALYTEYEYGKYLKSGDNPYAVLIELTYKNLSTYEIHPDTKIIAYGVFADCDRLSSIKIPDSVTGIGYRAFSGCSSLTSVVIGDSVTSIGSSAFSYCSSLTSVVIPDSVVSIGEQAFYLCYSLTDVYYAGTEAEWADIVIGDNNQYLTDATIHYNYIPEE
ncbi:MAG: leucine-rich repeat domain-containing protein [Clostridia bacterium]|nr:leucine-rich repeat domain-containing protein [Clostridia bacterium]